MRGRWFQYGTALLLLAHSGIEAAVPPHQLCGFQSQCNSHEVSGFAVRVVVAAAAAEVAAAAVAAAAAAAAAAAVAVGWGSE